MIYNSVSVSGVQQSDSVTHKHTTMLFQIFFRYRLLNRILRRVLCAIR